MLEARITNATRKAVYRRDGYGCALCGGSQTLQIHHCIPRSEGGSNDVQNLITVCQWCHSHLHGRPLYETDMTPGELAQMAVEYLADLYAGEWFPWTEDPLG